VSDGLAERRVSKAGQLPHKSRVTNHQPDAPCLPQQFAFPPRQARTARLRVLSPHGDAAGDAGPEAGAVSLGALAFGAATGDPGSLLAPAPGTP
jgi:hypothetical protein